MADFDPDAPDGGGLFGLHSTAKNAAVVVVPAPFDPDSDHPSASVTAVIAATADVPLHDPLVDEPWKHGVALASVPPALATAAHEASASSDASTIDGHTAAANQCVHDAAAQVLARDAVPGVLGGDHSSAFGGIQAAAKKYTGMGLLHIGGRAALRASHNGRSWSAESLVYNVCQRCPGVSTVVQVGITDMRRDESARIADWSKVTTFTDHELAWELGSGEPWMRSAARIVRPLPRQVWVSIDIAGLQPSLCPNTSAPVPGGLDWRQVQLLLQLLTEDHRIIGFDICGVASAPYDANIGARLLYRLASWAIHGRVNG